MDLISVSGISNNNNKLNLTGISSFTQNTNLNSVQNNQCTVDLKSLDINKNYSNCESTLEFFIISLSKNFNISSKQSVALLSNNKKYLLRLFFKGIKNDFSLPINWLNDINSNINILQNLMINSTDPKNVSMSFSTLSVGLYSNDLDCVRITNTILTKLSSEIGTDWEWFSTEGFLSYIFSLDKNPMINNSLVNALCLHIKGHEDDFIKIIKDKFTCDEEENGHKEIANFILNILPIINDNNSEDKDKKIQNGLINLIMELIEINNEKKNDGPLFISLITQSWLNNPEIYTSNKNIKNCALNYLKENIRIYGNVNNKFDTININSISCIANLFFLLNELGKIKNEDGPLIYRTLVFLFIEEYDEELKREFILDNFSHFFLMNLKFPIDIFITPYFKQIKRVKNISMADFNFIAVIIGHPRFTSEHALDLLDFLLDISLNNLIFSKSANMVLNLIFTMKLLIKNKTVFEKAQTKFIEYIIQVLYLYIANIKKNIKDNSILEVPYDIILEGFGNVNQEIEQTLINVVDQYRGIKGENSKALLGLLWFFKSHDDVLLRLEEKYSLEPKKVPFSRLNNTENNNNLKTEKNNNNNNKIEKNTLKPINKNKLVSNKRKEKENDDDINNVLKQSVDLAVKKMKGEKEEKMKIKKEKKLEQKRLKESRMKKQLEKELARKNAAFDTKKQRNDTFFDEVNFSQTNLIQEEGSVISPNNNGLLRRPISKMKLNTLMKYNNKYNFLVDIHEEEAREEKGIEALNIKYKPKIKNLVRILMDDSGNITKASILRYFRDKKINNSDLTLDELSLCVRNTFSANINLFDENQFKKLLVTISYIVMNKRRNTYTLCESYYNFLKLIIDDLDTNFNWKYKKYINILDHLKNNLDTKTGEIDVLLPPGFKIVQKTDIIYKSKIPKPMYKNFTESYAICLSLLNEFISNALNTDGILEKFLKIKKIYDIEIELSMVRPWTEQLMIAYTLLPKELEKYGIEAANALDDGLKNLFKGKDRKGETKMGNYEKEKIKNENEIKIIEQKKEDLRKKRGKELKTKVEQYKKEKEEKEKKNREMEEKKKEEEQLAFHNMIKESKKINKRKKEEINKMKQKKEEEKQEKLQEQKIKELEEEKLHKEEHKKFLIQQNKKMKEQFKQIKQQKEDFLKKKQELLPENQKIPKTHANYFKEDQNFIEFDRNLIPKLQSLMNSTNNISNFIKIYDQHLKLIFDIYHKIGQNKITSINGNNDDSLYLNEFKEFLANFGLLNILITKDQMNFIYKRLTRKPENKDNNEQDYDLKQYLTYNDFRISMLLLTIMTHLNNKELKITEDDYNLLNITKIEELFDYMGIKIPYIRKDVEKLINSKRGMSAKDFFNWQQKMKKEYYDKFKGIQRRPSERKNSIIPHSNSKRPKSSAKINKKTTMPNNININLKRVASKEEIDGRKNLTKRIKTYKNEVATTTAQTMIKKNSKIFDKKYSIKNTSNTSNNKKLSKSGNNSLEKNPKINNSTSEKKEKNKKNSSEKSLKIKKDNKKDSKKEIKKNTKNVIKKEEINAATTNNIKIKKMQSKEFDSKEKKIKNKSKEKEDKKEKKEKEDKKEKEKVDDKKIDNKNNNNNKSNNDNKQNLNNSDVSIVYASAVMEENGQKQEIKENNNDNNNYNENGMNLNNENEEGNEIEDNSNNNIKNSINKSKSNNEEKKNSFNNKKQEGYNMKIKTADGKEENWNIQI